MTAPILSVENLSIAYPTPGGRVHAVRDVSFEIKPGEVVGLVGESGCGKSTIAYAALRDIEGGDRIGGTIMFKGRDLFTLPERALRQVRGAEIGMVPQNPGASLTPTKTIGKQLVEVLTLREDIGSESARARVAEMLDRVHLPDAQQIMERYPHQLSGGQQQRVVIAGALLGRPDLLVLDEPTTGLDVTVEAAVLDLLREIRQATNLAMLYIAHNLGVIAGICDRVGVMYAGELVETAPVGELFRRPRHPYTRALLRSVPRVDRQVGRLGLAAIPGNVPLTLTPSQSCAFADRCAYVADICRAQHPSLHLGPPGHPTRCFRWNEIAEPPLRQAAVAPARDSSPDETVLAVDDLEVRYTVRRGRFGLRRSEVRAVDGVSLRVGAGEVVAVVGESGSGKSSLGAAIVGLRKPSGGRIRFLGRDLAPTAERRESALHRMLQIVFQDHSATLNPSVSIGRIIGRPLRLFGVVGRKDVAAEVRRLLTAVGLDPAMSGRHAAQLSGGQRQRVAIARAFAGRPKLVVCDEITSALDVSVQASVLNFLLRLQTDHATSLLFISHDLGVVRYVADVVLVMYRGRIVEAGSADAVFGGPNHPYTEALLASVPVPDPQARGEAPLRSAGAVAASLTGCPFHPRCPHKLGAICETETPPLREPTAGHQLWCHLPSVDLPRSRMAGAPHGNAPVALASTRAGAASPNAAAHDGDMTTATSRVSYA